MRTALLLMLSCLSYGRWWWLLLLFTALRLYFFPSISFGFIHSYICSFVRLSCVFIIFRFHSKRSISTVWTYLEPYPNPVHVVFRIRQTIRICLRHTNTTRTMKSRYQVVEWMLIENKKKLFVANEPSRPNERMNERTKFTPRYSSFIIRRFIVLKVYYWLVDTSSCHIIHDFTHR